MAARLRSTMTPSTVGYVFTPASLVTYGVDDTWFYEHGTVAPTYIDSSYLADGSNISVGALPGSGGSGGVVVGYGAARGPVGPGAGPGGFAAPGATTSVFRGTQGSVVPASIAAAAQQTTGLASNVGGAPSSLEAAQAVINAGLPAPVAAAASAAAAITGEPMVPVPAAYSGEGFTSARKASSSVQNYFFPPTWVSRATPITGAMHGVAVSAGAVTAASRT
jgi:hypothetical protein